MINAGKKASALAVMSLVVSIMLAPPVSMAQEFDRNKSAVLYCSQPLKVKIGAVYDYRYFAYASKAGSLDLNIKIEKGFANSLENLYPNGKAQLGGKQITVRDSTAFILHDLGGGELKLSGTDAQFIPSDKCDELVATMTATNGYSRQKLAEDEDLAAAQAELVKAVAAAAGTVALMDVTGYEPPARAQQAPASGYKYGAHEMADYLEENGYLGEKFEDEFDKFLAESAGEYEQARGMQSYSEIVDFLRKQYQTEYMEKIRGQISESQFGTLSKYAESQSDLSKELSDAEMKQALETLAKEKLYRHSSNPSKWLSLAEYISKADEGIGVEYRIVEKMPSGEFLGLASELNSKTLAKIYAPPEKTPHLQIFRKGTSSLIDEIPIFAERTTKYSGGGSIRFLKDNPSIKIIAIVFDKVGGPLQTRTAALVHEISHSAAYALGSYGKLHVGNSPKLTVEGMAVFDQARFADEQQKAGMPGYELENRLYKLLRLKEKSYENRLYGKGFAILEFLRDRLGGQEAIDKIKKGEILIDEKIDINGLDSIFRAEYSPRFIPLLDEINEQSDRFMRIVEKQREITDFILENIEEPDSARIGKYASDLAALQSEFDANPIDGAYGRDKIGRYVSSLKFLLEEYRDAPREQKITKFTDFMKTGIEIQKSMAAYLSEKAATSAKFYGGIAKESVPADAFNRLENAAADLLERAQKIKRIGGEILTEKSMEALNSAENSILKSRVPEELTKTAEVAKKSAGGATAAAAGMAMVFALGPKFAEYGEDNNNPYLVGVGQAIEYSGLGLFVASAGATVAKAVGMALPRLLSGLVLTAEGFLSGTVVGLLAVAFIEMAWCVINPFGALCFTYVQPILALSKSKGFAGEKISYTVSGFEVEHGIGNQEGKRYLLWATQIQLGSGCTVSGGKCAGEFTVPSMSSDTMKIFAQDIDNTFKSAAVVFGKQKNQLIMGATVVTDKSYLCMHTGEWKGETNLTMSCAKI